MCAMLWSFSFDSFFFSVLCLYNSSSNPVCPFLNLSPHSCESFNLSFTLPHCPSPPCQSKIRKKEQEREEGKQKTRNK